MESVFGSVNIHNGTLYHISLVDICLFYTFNTIFIIFCYYILVTDTDFTLGAMTSNRLQHFSCLTS